MQKNEKKGNSGQLQFEFEPIKGYPILKWNGKRPFKSTQYYPAQHKEDHGQATDNLMNQLYWGDNLQVMSHLLKDYRGKINLIYIDPPFDSKADYKKKIELKGQKVANDYNSFEEKQYTDIWTNDEYLQFMYERFILMRELLADNASIYVHMDEKRAHYIKVILDEVFGGNNFQREIIWSTKTVSGFKSQANNWIRSHDTIYFYTKIGDKIFIPQFKEYGDKYLARFKNIDSNGKRFRDDRSNGEKQYLDDLHGIRIGDVWDDVMSFQQAATSSEIVGYPTQKPEALLDRIIKASSNPGDIVFDCFLGSGTTAAVAMKLGRRFIGADINLGAIQITTKRLLGVAEEFEKSKNDEGLDIENAEEIKKFYTGFSVFNVNNYDFFRNPIEAKRILIEAYKIQPFSAGHLYDGELNGWMVKIMPADRIATRQDLNELASNFDLNAFERRKKENPNKPVEKILLICMGHEPDLAASLKQEVPDYELEVEVADVLRDKANLEFKRDSEAKLSVKKGKLTIDRFYPMNLMQKLSLSKQDAKDWREMVESVMIDWNFDGKVFSPTLTDIPEKKELVKGEYEIPSNAGHKIKIKITDLLSESYEEVIFNG